MCVCVCARLRGSLQTIAIAIAIRIGNGIHRGQRVDHGVQIPLRVLQYTQSNMRNTNTHPHTDTRTPSHNTHTPHAEHSGPFVWPPLAWPRGQMLGQSSLCRTRTQQPAQTPLLASASAFLLLMAVSRSRRVLLRLLLLLLLLVCSVSVVVASAREKA